MQAQQQQQRGATPGKAADGSGGGSVQGTAAPGLSTEMMMVSLDTTASPAARTSTGTATTGTESSGGGSLASSSASAAAGELEATIAALRAQLQEKDRNISELQAQLQNAEAFTEALLETQEQQNAQRRQMQQAHARAGSTGGSVSESKSEAEQDIESGAAGGAGGGGVASARDSNSGDEEAPFVQHPPSSSTTPSSSTALQHQQQQLTAWGGGAGGAGLLLGHAGPELGGGAVGGAAPVVLQSDEAFARAMQMMEVEMANAGVEVERPPAPHILEDPIWGRVEWPEGERPRPHQVLCFSFCPCLVGQICQCGWSTLMVRGREVRVPCRLTDQKASGCINFSWTMSFFIGVLQVAFLIISIAFSGGLAPTAINPMLGPYPHVLSDLGAKNVARQVYRDEWWRLFTPMLLHAGIIHLLVNVLVQWRIGVYLEKEWKSRPFLIIYVVSGVSGSILSSIVLPEQLGVGSSGALMGLMGAWFADILCSWNMEGDENAHNQRAFQLVIVFINIVITMSFSFFPIVDWAAHLGGLLGGMFVGAAFFAEKLTSERWQTGVRTGSLVVFVAALVAAIFYLATQVEPSHKLIHPCQYYRDNFADYPDKCN